MAFKLKKKKNKGSAGAGAFRYRKRSSTAARKRASQNAGNYDNPVKDEYPVFTAPEGLHCIRFLPPTWDDAEHYGFDVWTHRNIGTDGQTYICRKKMGLDPDCEICDEHAKAMAEGEKEYANALKPTRRVAVYLIDRDKEDEGVKVWLMPWTLDRDISALCEDRRTKEFLAIDDPDDGYDVEFERKGKQLNTEYIGVRIARSTSPLSDYEKKQKRWLGWLMENPLPKALKYYKASYIRKIFSSGVRMPGDEAKGKGKAGGKERPKTRSDREGRDPIKDLKKNSKKKMKDRIRSGLRDLAKGKKRKKV